MMWINKLVRYSLIAMVLISLILSWKIWTSPKALENEKNFFVSTNVLQERSPSDVFLPTAFVYRQENQVNYSKKDSTINAIQKEINKMNFQSIELLQWGDEEAFFNLKEQGRTLELLYPDVFSFNYYIEIFQPDSVLSLDFPIEFNSLLFSLDHHQMYLLTNEEYKIYEIILDEKLTAIEQILQQGNQEYLKASNRHEWLPHRYYLDEAIQLKKYSYILATQSYTTFSQAFFENTDDLYVQDDSLGLNLSNPENESLVINNDTREVTFVGKDQHEQNSIENNLYTKTFYYIARLGSSMGNLRYFSKNDTMVIYKNFVEGFPVMGDYDRGEIVVEITDFNNLEINANQDAIQIPIPSDEQVTLPSTLSMLQTLEEISFPMDEIENVQIGYTWKSMEEATQIVELSPAWYVKRKGEWMTVDEWQTRWKESVKE